MKRITKTVYTDDKGRELLTVKNGRATLESAYVEYAPDDLDELASACRAAAEELRNTTAVNSMAS